jgi:homoserine acetyltransferase
MLRSKTVNHIRDLAAQGYSIRRIAEETGIARNTIRKYLRGRPEPVPRRKRGSKLDPFKDQIRRWIDEDHLYNCQTMFERLRTMGYQGGLTMLRLFVAPLRPSRRLQFADDIRYTLTEPEFEVESYLRHQAETFVRRFDANTYLYTSRALTYFDLARQYGDGSLTDAVRPVSARTLLIAFSSDWLYPPAGSEELAAALRETGKDVEIHVIDAPYGHDCFLLEEARQTPMIQRFLTRTTA